MLQYTFSFNNAHRHFIDIEFHVDNHQFSSLVLQLPSWRPGRYELADFAKNIQYFRVHDMQGKPLSTFRKIEQGYLAWSLLQRYRNWSCRIIITPTN